mmetsp:Transcript_28449/g.57477  ORF Transcript_28449/g.57477 Transcript_28449/m.57477 type:complete len:686 (+) Transcript_28449:47-2104(+)
MASATALLNAEASCRHVLEVERFNQADTAMNGQSDNKREADSAAAPPCATGKLDAGIGGTAIESSNSIDSSHELTSEEPPRSQPDNLQNTGDLLENSESPFPAEKKGWSPLEEVDSALLSALCDSRERKGLLRLERVLVDFMKEGNLGHIEVGGPYNSIVVGGDSENTPQISGILQQSASDVQLQQQQQRGMRQTSFQRLILHRLADRFKIIRENVTSNCTDGSSNDFNIPNGITSYGGNAGQSNYPPSLIRLVKVNESCIPSNLLIDIDLSVLVNYKNPRARSCGGSSFNNDDGIKTITTSFSSSTLKDGPSMGGISGKSKSKKKMVIMKRNSSGSGSFNNYDGANSRGKRESKNRSGIKGKKLSDREKAYEEARARIFGNTESPISEGNNRRNDDSKAVSADGTTVDPIVEEKDGTGTERCQPSSSLVEDIASLNANAHSSDTGFVSPNPAAVELELATATDEQSLSSPDSQVQNDPSSGDSSRQNSSSSSTASVPAAAKSGAVLKAVYRNRQQEENDPDFRRRSDVRPGYTAMGGMVYGPYGGYNMNGAMHQPSVNSAAILQAQQAHQNYYYGQTAALIPPNAHMTQQDASYPSNLTNQSQPAQYFSPQVYYGGKEMVPQSRQRTTPRQHQATVVSGTEKQHLKPSQVLSGTSNKEQTDAPGAPKDSDNLVICSPEEFPALT